MTRPQLQRLDYVDFGDGVTGTIYSIDKHGWVRAWLSTSGGQLVLLSPFDLRRVVVLCRDNKRI